MGTPVPGIKVFLLFGRHDYLFTPPPQWHGLRNMNASTIPIYGSHASLSEGDIAELPVHILLRLVEHHGHKSRQQHMHYRYSHKPHRKKSTTFHFMSMSVSKRHWRGMESVLGPYWRFSTQAVEKEMERGKGMHLVYFYIWTIKWSTGTRFEIRYRKSSAKFN
jgi:hypothetical protein